MKTKNIFLAIFSLLTFATYAQTKEYQKTEKGIRISELKVETKNFDELKNFDWKQVKEMFQGNDPEQEITFAFAYVNPQSDKSELQVDNFEIKVTGKTANLDKLIARLKKIFKKMDKSLVEI